MTVWVKWLWVPVTLASSVAMGVGTGVAVVAGLHLLGFLAVWWGLRVLESKGTGPRVRGVWLEFLCGMFDVCYSVLPLDRLARVFVTALDDTELTAEELSKIAYKTYYALSYPQVYSGARTAFEDAGVGAVVFRLLCRLDRIPPARLSEAEANLMAGCMYCLCTVVRLQPNLAFALKKDGYTYFSLTSAIASRTRDILSAPGNKMFWEPGPIATLTLANWLFVADSPEGRQLAMQGGLQALCIGLPYALNILPEVEDYASFFVTTLLQFLTNASPGIQPIYILICKDAGLERTIDALPRPLENDARDLLTLLRKP